MKLVKFELQLRARDIADHFSAHSGFVSDGTKRFCALADAVSFLRILFNTNWQVAEDGTLSRWSLPSDRAPVKITVDAMEAANLTAILLLRDVSVGYATAGVIERKPEGFPPDWKLHGHGPKDQFVQFVQFVELGFDEKGQFVCLNPEVFYSVPPQTAAAPAQA